MNPTPDREDEVLIRYLLGSSLTEAEVERIEESYFSDDLYFEHLLAVEDELIDQHIRGSLPPALRPAFEAHFLSARRRREKWEAQRAIASFFRKSASPSVLAGLERFWKSQGVAGRFSVTAATAVVVVLIAVLGFGYVRLNQQTEQLRAHASAAEWPVTRVSLEPGLQRGGGQGAELRLASRSGTVLFHLTFNGNTSTFSSYSVGLRAADGPEFYRLARIPPTGLGLDVSVPAAVLSPGDYVLAVTGYTEVGSQELQSFVFRVVP